MRFFKIELIFLIFIFFISHNAKSEERWILDKELSEIKFELPVFLAKNVKGKFNEFEGYVILDLAKNLCNGKVVSILEGGYDLLALQESTEMHVNALLEFN